MAQRVRRLASPESRGPDEWISGCKRLYDSSSISEVAHIDMINGTTEDDERPAKERVSTEELLKPRCDLILA